MKETIVSVLSDVFKDAKRRDIMTAAERIVERLTVGRETIVVKGEKVN